MKVKYGLIPGGRAGSKYVSGFINIPSTEEEFEEAIEDGDIPDFTPSTGNLNVVLDAVKSNNLFVDWDVFEEGVFAIAKDGEVSDDAIELAVRRKFFEELD